MKRSWCWLDQRGCRLWCVSLWWGCRASWGHRLARPQLSGSGGMQREGPEPAARGLAKCVTLGKSLGCSGLCTRVMHTHHRGTQCELG